MKTQFMGEDFVLAFSRKSSAASYGRPVLVTEKGEAIDPFSFAFHVVVEISEDEVEMLACSGYPPPRMA